MSDNPSSPLILASGSKTRAVLLRAAGVILTIDPASIDEAAPKAIWQAEGRAISDQALSLAALKAAAVSARHPGRLVLGCDQMLDCDGQSFDKPIDLDAARRQLRGLRGRTHHLLTASVIQRDGQTLWQFCDRAELVMRDFSDTFLETYLHAAGDRLLDSVGAYQLEQLGAQLFDRVSGDYFTILGLPLLPILEFLRAEGVLPI